jgi:hypothetical protein
MCPGAEGVQNILTREETEYNEVRIQIIHSKNEELFSNLFTYYYEEDETNIR